MVVDGRYSLIRPGHQQLGLHELLDREHDAVLHAQPDRRPRVLDRFVRVLDLRVVRETEAMSRLT